MNGLYLQSFSKKLVAENYLIKPLNKTWKQLVISKH